MVTLSLMVDNNTFNEFNNSLHKYHTFLPVIALAEELYYLKGTLFVLRCTRDHGYPTFEAEFPQDFPIYQSAGT